MTQDRPNMGSKNRSKRREKEIPGDVEKRVEKLISGGGAKILATPPDRGKKVTFWYAGGRRGGGKQIADLIAELRIQQQQRRYKDTGYKDTRIQDTGYKDTRIQDTGCKKSLPAWWPPRGPADYGIVYCIV